jgi:hypothetical protein
LIWKEPNHVYAKSVRYNFDVPVAFKEENVHGAHFDNQIIEHQADTYVT